MDIKKDLGMNLREDRFCHEFIIDLNGTKAAIRAKYSEKTARIKASQLLAKANVRAKIRELMKKREKRTEITQDKVLRELACLGFSNIKDYIAKDASGEGFIVFKNMDKISKKKARAIESIKVCLKEGKIEFKLHSKTRSLDMIGKHLGMFIEKVEHSGKLDYAVFMMPRPGGKEKDAD